MSNSEQQNSDISVVEDFTPDYADSMGGKTADYNGDSVSSKTTDIAAARKTTRPKIMLSAVVTCPRCGTTNKPEWVTKSRHGDNYATTMWCEQCGSLIAVWATHVEAQIVAHNQDH